MNNTQDNKQKSINVSRRSALKLLGSSALFLATTNFVTIKAKEAKIITQEIIKKIKNDYKNTNVTIKENGWLVSKTEDELTS